MKIAYLQGRAKTPQPALRGSLIRLRPITAIRISGPTGSWILDGLLDTGSDDTIFPEWLAPMIGLNLDQGEERNLQLAGRGKPIRCRYMNATLRLTDGQKETYSWEAVIGFVSVPLKNPLLGHAGFLQFFDATFQGAASSVILLPNNSFPGVRT